MIENTSKEKPLIIQGERDKGKLCGWEIKSKKKESTDREVGR